MLNFRPGLACMLMVVALAPAWAITQEEELLCNAEEREHIRMVRSLPRLVYAGQADQARDVLCRLLTTPGVRPHFVAEALIQYADAVDVHGAPGGRMSAREAWALSANAFADIGRWSEMAAERLLEHGEFPAAKALPVPTRDAETERALAAIAALEQTPRPAVEDIAAALHACRRRPFHAARVVSRLRLDSRRGLLGQGENFAAVWAAVHSWLLLRARTELLYLLRRDAEARQALEEYLALNPAPEQGSKLAQFQRLLRARDAILPRLHGEAAGSGAGPRTAQGSLLVALAAGGALLCGALRRTARG